MSSEPGTVDLPPTAADEYADQGLRRVLASFGLFPTEEDRERRLNALRELEQLGALWVQQEVKKLQEAHELGTSSEYGGVKIFTYGSFPLGVFTAKSDIDALLVGPKYVTLEMFMSHFPDYVHEGDKSASVVPIPDARAPIIKMTFKNVDIDLMFAPMPLDYVDPALSIDGNDIMLHMKDSDPRTIRNLCGTRDTNIILKLVPQQRVFTNALCFVRFWAKERGITGNKVGLLANFTLAVLVARVCCDHPQYNAAMVLLRFFHYYNTYDWSKPVMLCPVVQEEEVFGRTLENTAFKSYTLNAYDLKLMPVLTPAFPTMNSTSHVNRGTFDLIKSEFARAAQRIDNEEFVSEHTWLLLCARTQFFGPSPKVCRYRLFCCVSILGTTGVPQEEFDEFKGFVESRLINIGSKVEALASSSTHEEGAEPPKVLCHPLFESFKPKEMVDSFPEGIIKYNYAYFIGILSSEPLSVLHDHLKRPIDDFMKGITKKKGDLNELREKGLVINVGLIPFDMVPPSVRNESRSKAQVKMSHIRNSLEEVEKERKRRESQRSSSEPPDKRIKFAQ